MAKNYREWLKEQDNTLSQDNAVNHKKFVRAGIDLTKSMKLFLDHFGRGGRFPITKFSPEEEKKLREAVTIIEGAMVPVALIKVKQEEPMILLGDYSYDRQDNS